MADVPPGKVCYWFDHVDMARAKEVLGGKACIAGNVPIALLSVGTPDEVRAYCRNLIDTVGQGRRVHPGTVRPDRGRQDRERGSHGGLRQGIWGLARL